MHTWKQPPSGFQFKPIVVATGLALGMAFSVNGVADTAGNNTHTSQRTTYHFDIASKPLPQALADVASLTNLQVFYAGDAAFQHTAPALRGQYTLTEALDTLLSGSSLGVRFTGQNAITIEETTIQNGNVSLPTVNIDGARAKQTMNGVERPVYAGNQVSTMSSTGLLGDKDFMENPFSTVSYTENYIEDQQAHDLGSAIGASDPSVYVPSKRNIFETFLIRGFSTTMDDVSFNGLVGLAPKMRGSTEMASNIDVLKGPSTFLNGMSPNGSVAGSINIVPKRAQENPEASLTTTYESDGLWGAHIDAGSRFGDQNQWGVRYNGVYRDGDTAVDHQEHEMEMNSLNIDWRSDRVRISADLYKQKEDMKSVDYFGIFGVSDDVTTIPSPKNGSYALAPEWSYSNHDSETIALRGEYDISDSVMAYAAIGQKDGGYDSLITRNSLINDAGDISVIASKQLTDSKDKSAVIGVRGSLETGSIGHDWSVAANRYEYDLYNRGAYFFDLASVNYYNIEYGAAPDLSDFSMSKPPKQAEKQLKSFAVSDTLSFVDGQVQLTLGARHQGVKSKNFNADGSVSSSYDESRVSPSIAIVTQMTDQTSVYANYIEGLSQGSTAPDEAVNAGEVLEPYKTEQYEAGVKIDLGNFAHTVSIYRIERPSTFTDPETLVFDTYGEQRNQGVEWSFFGELQPGLRLIGGASYSQAELTKTLNGLNQGNQVTGIPKFVARLGTEYDLQSLDGVTLNANLNHIGKRNVTADERLTLPSYTLLDVGVKYRTQLANQPLTLRATLQNATDEKYWLGSRSSGGNSGLSGGLGAPRTLMLSGKMDF